MSRALCRFAAGAALLLTGGCYSYQVVPTERAPVGAHVRTRLSAEQGARVGEVLGREDRVLAGKVVRNDDESLLLSVPSVVRNEGLVQQRLRQNLTIPRPDILELEVRRLDPWRTGALVAGAAVVVGYVVLEVFDAGGSAPGGDRPGGNEARIPLGSFAVW